MARLGHAASICSLSLLPLSGYCASLIDESNVTVTFDRDLCSAASMGRIILESRNKQDVLAI